MSTKTIDLFRMAELSVTSSEKCDDYLFKILTGNEKYLNFRKMKYKMQDITAFQTQKCNGF